MNFITTQSTFKAEKKPSLEKKPLVSFYTDAPQMELSLDEFEMLSLDRLQMLRNVEQLKAKQFEEKEFNDKMKVIESTFLNGNKMLNTGRMDNYQRDNISHFILRLAYCANEDLRKWFLTQECALMKYRVDTLDDGQRAAFMASTGLDFEQVSEREKMARGEKLCGLSGITPVTLIKTNFYKVPFQQALSLVQARAVLLEDGYAFVPATKLVATIITRFRVQLSRALVEAANMFDVVADDARIAPLLKNMNKQFIGNDFSTKSQSIDQLTPEKVDLAADINMPLCMKNLHVHLQREHKLKHWGRLQYGLFLKGAGLDLEGANQFWERHFTRVMSHEQFVKGYAYSFRHMYGKEGARKNYTPFSCMKIIMGAPPETGAHHGCPYRHAPESQLNSMLTGTLKLSSVDAREVASLAKQGNFQVACQRHFDITHPKHSNPESVANHPNQWFMASVNYHKAKNGLPIASAPSSASQGAVSAAAAAAASDNAQDEGAIISSAADA